MVSVQFGVTGDFGQEHLGHLQRTLVDGRTNGSLQDHLQHLGVSGVLVGGEGQLLRLLLHVLYRHLDGRRDNLFFVDDVDPRLDVREGVGGGEDGLAFELLVQVPVRPPVQGERGAVHEAPQVVVLVEVGDAVLHLVRVEVRLHVGDLDERLIWIQLALVYWVGVFNDFDLVLSVSLAVETLQPVGDLRQLRDGGLLVHELLLVQVAKL